MSDFLRTEGRHGMKHGQVQSIDGCAACTMRAAVLKFVPLRFTLLPKVRMKRSGIGLEEHEEFTTLAGEVITSKPSIRRRGMNHPHSGQAIDSAHLDIPPVLLRWKAY